MLDDLLRFYLSEELGRQILKKIPYSLFISLVTYVLFFSGTGENSLGLGSELIAVILLIVFIVSTFRFQSLVNRKLSALFSHFDFKSVVGTFGSIYESQASFLDDIDRKRIKGLLVSGLLNGISLTSLLVTALLLLLVNLRPGAGVSVALAMVGTVYLVYDISKSSVVEAPADDSQGIQGSDVIERYVVTNSFARLPTRLRSQALVYIAGRLIGPLLNMRKPDLSYETPLVYDTQELVDFLKQMTGKNAEAGVSLVPDGGDDPNQFFVGEPTDDKISALVERSARKVFPYLLDPKYSAGDRPKKGWMSYLVIDLAGNQKVGRIFIHRFKVVSMKPLPGMRRRFWWRGSQRRTAFQFIMFGKRSYIQYIASQIGMNSFRVPPTVLSGETLAE